MIRTSETDPIHVAEVDVGTGRGKIGVTFAPGKNDRHSSQGPWARDLDKDLDAIAAWGAKAVVTLLEPQELGWLAITRLGAEVERRGIAWVHMPIPDVSMRIPTEPATYSDLNPATLIDAAPVGLWARRPSSIATLNHNGSALSTSPQAGRELPC